MTYEERITPDENGNYPKEYWEPPCSPEMKKVLQEVREGKNLVGPFNSTEEMWEDMFGKNWRDVVKPC